MKPLYQIEIDKLEKSILTNTEQSGAEEDLKTKMKTYLLKLYNQDKTYYSGITESEILELLKSPYLISTNRS